MTGFRILPGHHLHQWCGKGEVRHIHVDQPLDAFVVDLCFRVFDELGINEHSVFSVECGGDEGDPVIVTYWPDHRPLDEDGGPLMLQQHYPRRL